jgi:hypothetical protein
MYSFLQKPVWDTFWAMFSLTHLGTLPCAELPLTELSNFTNSSFRFDPPEEPKNVSFLNSQVLRFHCATIGRKKLKN